MEVEVVGETARRRAAFISNPLFFLKKHRELRSLISKDLITFPQPRKTSKSVLDNCGVRFSCPKKHIFSAYWATVSIIGQSLGFKLHRLAMLHLIS